MGHNKNFTHIIVDLDGTLIDESLRLEAQAKAVSEKFGSSHESIQAVIDAFFVANDRAVIEGGENKNNIPQYMKWIAESLNISITDEESKTLASAWMRAYKESLATPYVFSDTFPFLEGAQERGYELILATGGTIEEKKYCIDKAGISDFVKKIYTSAEVGFQKQDKRFWEFILAELHVPAEQILVVGNQINDDILWPSQLGMKTVLVNRSDDFIKQIGSGSLKPEYEVTTLQSILTFI